MATRVQVTMRSRDEDSVAVPVVIKTALTGDRQDRRAEADWLVRCERLDGQPPAIRLLEVTDDPFISLITHHQPGPTLRTMRAEPTEVAAVLVQLARNLVRLHDAGLVHAKLTPDHVLVGPDGPVLCSPDGRADDVTIDSIGLGLTMRSLVERWGDLGVTVPNRGAWEHLIERLIDAESPLPMRRAVRALSQLADPVEPTRAGHHPAARRARLPAGMALVATVVAVSLLGLGLTVGPGIGATGPTTKTTTDPATGAAAGPVVVEVEGALYHVTITEHDLVVVPEPACPGQPGLAIRTAGEGPLWRYDRGPAGGWEATEVAIESLDLWAEPDPDRNCQTIWLTTPAGPIPLPDAAASPNAEEGP